MREIKFRGISKEKGIFVYGCYIKASNGKEEIHAILEIEKSIDCITEVIKESIGQFTGLQDKNGVDIYEGDILRKVIELDGGVTDYWTVVYGEAGFDILNNDKKAKIKQIYLKKYWKHSFEVIGNIHEHLNLLK